MTETVGIIGLVTRHGRRVSRRRFERVLAATCKGATVQYARGLWRRRWEPNAIVTVAGRGARRRLLTVARELEQEALYLRNGDGRVQILSV